MRLIRPSAAIVQWTPDAMRTIESAGRCCYQSEPAGDTNGFVRKLVKLNHLSVLEHVSATVQFIVDRGVSHELVRHRIASFSQESTRYCAYEDHVTFIVPPWLDIDPGEYPASFRAFPAYAVEWTTAMRTAEGAYFRLRDQGWSPQQARSVLPNSLKTEMYVTANFREWRHIFELRTAKAAHPQMREVMIPLLDAFRYKWPAAFGDLPARTV